MYNLGTSTPYDSQAKEFPFPIFFLPSAYACQPQFLPSILQCLRKLSIQAAVQCIDLHHPENIDHIHTDLLIVLLTIKKQEEWVVDRFRRIKANQETPIILLSEVGQTLQQVPGVSQPAEHSFPLFNAAVQLLLPDSSKKLVLNAVIIAETKDGHAAYHPVVLIADDNETGLHILEEYLGLMGYSAVLARDGIEAVQKAKECKPDLILMDIQMPRMNGFAAIQQIRNNRSTSSTPIIALTACNMLEDRQRCLNVGANAYLSKPVSLKELLQMIKAQTL